MTSIEDLSKEIIHHRKKISEIDPFERGAKDTSTFHQVCIQKLQAEIKDQVGFVPHIYESNGGSMRTW